MNGLLHVVFGAGPVGLATADALAAVGEVRVVNRSGAARKDWQSAENAILN